MLAMQSHSFTNNLKIHPHLAIKIHKKNYNGKTFLISSSFASMVQQMRNAVLHRRLCSSRSCCGLDNLRPGHHSILHQSFIKRLMHSLKCDAITETLPPQPWPDKKRRQIKRTSPHFTSEFAHLLITGQGSKTPTQMECLQLGSVCGIQSSLRIVSSCCVRCMMRMYSWIEMK